jgi:MFS family permease
MTTDSGHDGQGPRTPDPAPRHPLGAVLRSSSLRRVLLAFFVFKTTETATWIAILVWAYDTGGAAAAGLIAVIQLVPATIVAPFASVIGDRMRRDRALSLGYAIQAVTMIATGAALALEAPTGAVYVLAACAATSIVLTRPVHNAIIPEIAETPEQLTAGNASSSTVEGASLFVGPLLAALVLGLSGPGAVFLIMGTLTIGSALITRSLRLQRTFEPDESGESAVAATLAGLRELRTDSGALMLTAVVGAQFVVVGLMDILSVVLGIEILGLGQGSPGLFLSGIGIGALVGAAGTIVLVGRRRLSPAIAGGMLLTGVALTAVALVSVPAIALVLFALAGAGKAFVDVAGRTLLQRTVRPDVLSRIFGIQESLLMGGLALGSAMAPVLVHVFGPRGAFVAAGLLLPVIGLLALTRIRRLDATALQPGPGFALLQSVPMFGLLPQATLEQLSRDLVAADFAEDTLIVRQGDDGDRFYLVKTGSVDIIKDTAVIAVTTAGGYFGEIALLRDVPRIASVRARGSVTVYTLEREPFLQALTGSSTSHEIAHQEAQRRIQQLDDEP